MRGRRGFTIAEVMTVLVIVGLILAVIAMITPMIFRSQSQVQAQTDSIQSTALALYKVQRDVRQSNIGGVLACTTVPVVVCTQPSASNAQQTQAIAIVTADNGSGQFVPNNAGSPKWHGFVLYWLTPNADGTSNDLKRAYYGWPGNLNLTTLPTVEADAVVAVTNVLGSQNSVSVAQDVRTLRMSVDTSNNIVLLGLDGGNTTGNVSSLDLTSNSYVRN
jgi:prepilin-type N-terminal cleavage/methylation domain-containing protein